MTIRSTFFILSLLFSMLTAIWGHLSYFLVDFREFLILIFISIFLSLYAGISIYKSSLSETQKRAVLSIVFFSLSFVLAYCGFEAYFRYRFDESDSLGFLNSLFRADYRNCSIYLLTYIVNNYLLRHLLILLINSSISKGFGR